MAFGAFLVGMMLGDTEFRHQVESAIRPFRDVLLGLFFIAIGMMFDLSAIPDVWHLALAGTAVLLVTKILLVAPMVRWAGVDTLASWRVALVLAVGGEFGFALLAIAFTTGVVTPRVEQIVLMSLLLSIVVAPLLIRHNHRLAALLSPRTEETSEPTVSGIDVGIPPDLAGHVILCGYGRVGHTVAALLEQSGIAFIAYDTDLARVAQGRAVGHSVLFGDIADPDLLATGRVDRASLIVITIDRTDTALRAVAALRTLHPQLPIIARARDLEASGRLLAAGATQAYPEAIEASLRLGAAALQMVGTTAEHVDELLQGVRDGGYGLVRDDEAHAE
jgi:CPA2 family monovalent cation:H+ antiporter-2